MNDRIKTAYVVIICVICVTYLNTLFNSYSLDDELVTGPNNELTQNLSNVKAIFTSWYDEQLGSNYEYRPIVKLSYALENQFFGLKPGVHHFFNMLYYSLCCILLFRFLYRLLDGNYYFALAATLLFTVHPMHTEVVASLKNRDIMIVFILAMLAGLRLIKIFEEKDFRFVKFIPVVVLFYLAMLSKRDALSFVFILPVILWLKYRASHLKALTTILIIAGSYLLLLFTLKTILPEADGGRTMEFFENPIVKQRTFANRIIAMFNCAGFYTIQNLFPVKQVCYYGYNAIEVLRPSGIYFFSGIFSLGAGTFFFFRNLKKDPLLSYGLCFLLGGMILYLNAVKPVPGIVGDRFTFVSTIGFSLLFVYAVQKIFKLQLKNIYVNKQISVAARITFATVIVLFSVLIINRNRQWKDKETLFKNDVKKEPASAKLHSLYALEMIQQYRELAGIDIVAAKEKALVAKDELKKSLEIYPDYINSMSNLGYILLQLNEEPGEALRLLEKASTKKPDNTEIQINYASALIRNEKYAEGEKILIKTLQLKKHPPELYLLLMRNADKTKNYVEVAGAVSKSATPAQKTEALYTDIGNLFARGNDTLNAIANYDSAVTISPVNKNLGKFLFNYYKSKGMEEKAERIRMMFSRR